MEQQELITRCARQDHHAQQELYRLYYPAMMGFCRRMSSGQEEALLILQEAFIQLFTRIRHEKNIPNLDKWVKQHFVHVTVSHLRKNLGQHIVSSTGRGGVDAGNRSLDDVSFEFANSMSSDDFLHAVQQLPVVYRILINLITIDNLPPAEVSKLLEMSEGTLFSNVQKAEFRLKNILWEMHQKKNESGSTPTDYHLE